MTKTQFGISERNLIAQFLDSKFMKIFVSMLFLSCVFLNLSF